MINMVSMVLPKVNKVGKSRTPVNYLNYFRSAFAKLRKSKATSAKVTVVDTRSTSPNTNKAPSSTAP